MTRKLKLFFATSLDGFIAGPSGELDWLIEDQDYGYNEFVEGIDTLVMGRRTYDMISEFPNWPYGDRKIYVLCRRECQPTDDRVIFSTLMLDQFFRQLRREEGGDVWLVGGNQMIEAALEHDLIDEIVINIHPVALGEGVPVFPGGSCRLQLSLIHHHVFERGLVSLRYHVDRTKRNDQAASPLVGLKWGRLQKCGS